MLKRTLKLFIPNYILNKREREVFYEGYIFSTELSITIYLIQYSPMREYVWDNNQLNEKIIHGVSSISPRKDLYKKKFKNYIVIDHNLLKIQRLIVNGNEVNVKDDCIIVMYDYDKILNTEVLCDSGSEFANLQLLVKKHNNTSYTRMDEQMPFEPMLKKPFWLSYSMFGQHVVESVNLTAWLITSIRRNKKISIKQVNLIMSMLVNILLGYFVLQFLTISNTELSATMMEALEKLVNSLYTLLKWLMGAPAGLKLNNAFNKMLGKYFSYHIQLWWLFLDVSGQKLETILELFQYIGYAGFSFQAAIAADMLCLATFHSYCIYVYAARLFNIQVCGLTALLRLFVGRKRNPLRGGIDSCEYCNQQLFVGTVAVTTLLLLLPTTAMYYAVFTLFRLLSVVVQHVLAKTIYLVQTAPLYACGLWAAGSSKVAGNILMEVVKDSNESAIVLKLKLSTEPLCNLVEYFKPPVQEPSRVEWTNILANVFTGKQMI